MSRIICNTGTATPKITLLFHFPGCFHERQYLSYPLTHNFFFVGFNQYPKLSATDTCRHFVVCNILLQQRCNMIDINITNCMPIHIINRLKVINIHDHQCKRNIQPDHFFDFLLNMIPVWKIRQGVMICQTFQLFFHFKKFGHIRMRSNNSNRIPFFIPVSLATA